MQLAPPICSERLFLRTLTHQDATEAYLSWFSDPEITSYLEIRFSPPRTVTELSVFISETNVSSDTLMAGIFLQADSRHIGNIKLGPINWHHSVGDLGFVIGDKREWGKGYASEAIAALSHYAFSELELAKLTAGFYADNPGSGRALAKAGFVEEGRRRSQWVSAGRRQDGILVGRVNPAL